MNTASCPAAFLIEAFERAIRLASTTLAPDVAQALEKALDTETGENAKLALRAMLDNVRVAREAGLPLCQDTGTATFFVRAGVGSPWLPSLEEAMRRAVARAGDSVPLRPSAIDPFTQRNVGHIGPGLPIIDWLPIAGDDVEITFVAKGGGSENASALFLLPPADGLEAVRQAVLSHVVCVAPRACPPLVVGVGVGGTADFALRLAKRALLRRLSDAHPDSLVAGVEREILQAVNRSGIGPMGWGGLTTALAVHVEVASRHPASLPVGVAVQCWAARRATVRIAAGGSWEVEP